MKSPETRNIFKMLGNLAKKPVFLGILIGFIAALFQALFISAGGPVAYGFCVACHTRDMIDALWNALFSTALLVAIPMGIILTMVGVFLGGFSSAKLNKEFKIKKSSIKTYLLYFGGGVAVIIFALFLGGCPYRAALRFGYGDLTALIGILSIIGGVVAGLGIINSRMKRRSD
ncbi:MAG: YeeE/YedE family protein [Candidatus Lokiarchaeota archaeon]|nr:YeeE/YedE family protein [Candidatus Lokiarchaeota archaeon]